MTKDQSCFSHPLHPQPWHAVAVCNLRLAEFCLRPKAFWADADADAAAAEQDGAGTVSLGQELNFAAPSTLTQWHLD